MSKRGLIVMEKDLELNTMTKTTTAPCDVAEHLRTREEMAAYLEASIDEAGGNAAFVAKALGDIARARGMAQVANNAGLSRESLSPVSGRPCRGLLAASSCRAAA